MIQPIVNLYITNEYGFYIAVGDSPYFIFWRNLVNSALIILVIILLYFLVRFIVEKRVTEKTTTYSNDSSIIKKWNRRAIITFPDLSVFIGKVNNGIPHGRGTFYNNEYPKSKLKFIDGASLLVDIYKTEEGYCYQLHETPISSLPDRNLQGLLKWLVIVNCAALFIAILKMPYGYYAILRILTTITGCVLAYVSYKTNKFKTAVLSGLLVVVYNPLIPIPLGKDIWIIVNLISIPLIIIFYVKSRKL